MEDASQDNVCSFCKKTKDKIKRITFSGGQFFICIECRAEFKKMIDNPGDDAFRLPVSIEETGNTELDRKLAELSIKYQIAAIDISAFDLDPETIKLIPAPLCMEYCIIPINKYENSLIVAIADPSTMEDVKKVLGKNTGLEIEFLVADKQAIIDKIPHAIN